MDKKIAFSWNKMVYEETIEGNLELSEITPADARNGMGKAVGRYAFYGALMADAIKLQSKLTMEYDYWYAQKYREVSDGAGSKMTEGAKKGQIMLDFNKEYQEWQAKLRDLQSIIDKMDILRSAFKLQSNTLQTIAYSLKAEIEMAHGSGPMAQGTRDMVDENK